VRFRIVFQDHKSRKLQIFNFSFSTCIFIFVFVGAHIDNRYLLKGGETGYYKRQIRRGNTLLTTVNEIEQDYIVYFTNRIFNFVRKLFQIPVPPSTSKYFDLEGTSEGNLGRTGRRVKLHWNNLSYYK